MREQQIRKFLESQEITQLVHFTRVENLQSIMEHGIVPLELGRQRQFEMHTNDAFRWDGHTDASCLSISFPNAPMFYKCRQADLLVDWVLLGIAPDILWEKDCAFCKRNAASNEIRFQTLNILKSPQSLAGMFEEIPGHSTRAEQGLQSSFTTDVQAEVLVFDTIEPEYIFGAIFDKQGTKTAYEHYLGDRTVILNGTNTAYFNRR